MECNSKEALAQIMREHGENVLLGSVLKIFFDDYAPGIKIDRKNAVLCVIESGAAEILKRNLDAGAEEKEIAFRRAVQKMVEEYSTERSVAESVILEFTAALGWKINNSATEIADSADLADPVKPVQQKRFFDK